MEIATARPATQSCLTEAFDFIPDAVIVAAADGVIAAANESAERLFSYPRAGLVGLPIAPNLLREWCGPAADCIETSARRRDGAEMMVEVTRLATSAAEGTLIVHVIRDVTLRHSAFSELQDCNAALRATDQAKDRFLASLGHEMRTQLNAIICFAALMLEQRNGHLSADQARKLGIVKNCGEHLLALSNDLLDLGRIAAGKATLCPERLDVGEVLHELHDALTPLAEAKGLAMAIELDSAQLRLEADRRALRQILVNLIGNAIKYTDRGSISLRAARGKGAWLRLSVVDTGVGIDTADRDQLFQEFMQLGNHERRCDGAGLGLHLCARIAKLMGAHIEVHSAPGQGSEFTLVLPMLAPAQSLKRSL